MFPAMLYSPIWVLLIKSVKGYVWQEILVKANLSFGNHAGLGWDQVLLKDYRRKWYKWLSLVYNISLEGLIVLERSTQKQNKTTKNPIGGMSSGHMSQLKELPMDNTGTI